MGWLRDLMAQSGHRSFGELARQALAHPEWPLDCRAQPRSLEAILGRLDRREELDWLTDRPGVQQVLAALLKSQVAEIRTVLVSVASTKNLPTRLRLDDLPTTRALELQHDALPPTIPERVGLPATWRRLAWVAKPGAGFSLVRHWLLARGLAQAHLVESLEQFRSLNWQGSPQFLEVDVRLCAQCLDELPESQPVCLTVTDLGAVSLSRLAQLGFDVVHSSPIRTELERVVDWTLARSVHGSQSRRARLLEWLQVGPLAWNAIETLGDVFGFVGAYLACADQIKLADTKETFLRQWLSLRTEELARERLRDKSVMVHALPDALIDIAQTALLDDSFALHAPRSLEEWLALVPAQHQRGPDLDWLTAQVGADPQALRTRDLERVAKRLPPGAHRIVVALRELLLLRPTSATQFALRPHFLVRLLASVAKDKTINSLPVFWGEALLKPGARPSLLSALELRIAQSPETVAEDLLEVVEAESAPLVSALETSFVLLGLELLAGGELSDAAVAGLLEEQNALLLCDLEPLPLRRTAPGDSGQIEDSEGAFYLAAFALSEPSKIRRSKLHPLLDPWSQSEPQPGWELVLDAVATTLKEALPAAPRWLPGALRLLDRLRQSIGSDVEKRTAAIEPNTSATVPHESLVNQRTHPVFCPGMLLDAVELSVFGAAELHELLRYDWQFDLLMATVSARQMPWSDVAESLWSSLIATLDTERATAFLRRIPLQLWSESPAELVAQLMLRPNAEVLPIPWSQLPLRVWTAWSQKRTESPTELEPVRPWQEAPASVGESTARNAKSPNHSIRQLIWRRWPPIGIEQVERNRTLRPTDAVAWLEATPVEVTSALSDAAVRYEWHKADARVRVGLLRCLHRGIRFRAPGWATAYDCLQRFESESRRFAR